MATERIVIEISESGARTVNRSLEGIGRTASGTGRSIGLLRQALVSLGAAFALRVTAQFGDALARVRAVSGLTADAFSDLREEILRLSAASGTDPAGAAQALFQLQRSGLGAAAAMKTLKQAMKLADVGGQSLAESTEAVARVTTAFGVTGKQAANVLGAASLRSQESVTELTASITRSANAARAANVGLEDVTAAIITLSRSGAEGRIAIAGLREGLEALETPTQKERALFQELGLNLDRLRPSVTGITGSLQELARAGVSFEVLGVRGGAALDVLAARTGDVRDLVEEMGRAGKITDDFAKAIDESLGKAFKELLASVKALILSFGGEGGEAGLAAAVRVVAEEIQGLAVITGQASQGLQRFFEFFTVAQEDKVERARLRTAGLRVEIEKLMRTTRAGAEARGIIEIGPPSPVSTTLDEAFPQRARAPTREERLRTGEAGALRAEEEAIRRRSAIRDQAISQAREIADQQDRLRISEEALIEAVNLGTVSRQQANRALAELRLQMPEAISGLQGMQAALFAVDTSAGALGASIGQSLVGAIDTASGALAEFAISGARNTEDLREAFAKLLEDLGKQILQLIIKTLILKAIQIAIGDVAGGGGGAAAPILTGSSLGTGFQAGGPVRRGQIGLVGERGPELVQFGGAGHVVPAGETAEMLEPQVNIRVINVTDPNEITSTMNSPTGEQVILNVLSRNARAMRRILG